MAESVARTGQDSAERAVKPVKSSRISLTGCLTSVDEERDLLDAMPLKERHRTGLPLTVTSVDLIGKALWVCFVLLAVSGVGLLGGYRPSTDASFFSVNEIQTRMAYGWWFRGVHKYAADLFILFAALRFLRIWHRRAYRASGESTWLACVATLALGLLCGLTGSLLVWNRAELWEGDVPNALGLMQTMPAWVADEKGLTGPFLILVFAAHISLSVVFLLAVVYWRTAPRSQSPRYNSFLPAISGWLVLAFTGGLTTLAFFAPPPLGGPADSASVTLVRLADWYMLPFCGLAASIGRRLAALVLGAALLAAFLWPRLDRLSTTGPRPLNSCIVAAAVITWLLLGAAGLSSTGMFSWLWWSVGGVWVVCITTGFLLENGPAAWFKKRPMEVAKE